jgi:hypothetical protein
VSGLPVTTLAHGIAVPHTLAPAAQLQLPATLCHGPTLTAAHTRPLPDHCYCCWACQRQALLPQMSPLLLPLLLLQQLHIL